MPTNRLTADELAAIRQRDEGSCRWCDQSWSIPALLEHIEAQDQELSQRVDHVALLAKDRQELSQRAEAQEQEITRLRDALRYQAHETEDGTLCYCVDDDWFEGDADEHSASCDAARAVMLTDMSASPPPAMEPPAEHQPHDAGTDAISPQDRH